MNAFRDGPALNRQGREQLLRYCLRPAVCLKRISLLSDGSIAYEVKYPRNGRGHRILSSMEFMACLASIVAPPRIPLVRYHGVLAPNCKHRSALVPGSVVNNDGKSCCNKMQQQTGEAHKNDASCQAQCKPKAIADSRSASRTEGQQPRQAGELLQLRGVCHRVDRVQRPPPQRGRRLRGLKISNRCITPEQLPGNVWYAALTSPRASEHKSMPVSSRGVHRLSVEPTRARRIAQTGRASDVCCARGSATQTRCALRPVHADENGSNTVYP